MFFQPGEPLCGPSCQAPLLTLLAIVTSIEVLGHTVRYCDQARDSAAAGPQLAAVAAILRDKSPPPEPRIRAGGGRGKQVAAAGRRNMYLYIISFFNCCMSLHNNLLISEPSR